jgi:hypothetical protein
MGRRGLALTGSVVAAVVALVVALAAFAAGGPGPVRCPGGVLAFTANPVGPAAAVALRADSARNRPLVTGATIAPQDTARGGEAKARCGTRVWQRTVVVHVLDRSLLPSASLSQRVYFVSRFRSGYRIWARVH